MMLHMLERALIEWHGDIPSAARACGTSGVYVRAWMEADPPIAAKLHAAQVAGWESLESVAYQRAVHGTKKGVWYKGDRVGEETEYSDKLLTDMLKARVPAYSAEPATTSMSVNVAIMPRANSYEDWLVQRDKALKPQPVIDGVAKPTIRPLPYEQPLEPEPYRPLPMREEPLRLPDLSEPDEPDINGSYYGLCSDANLADNCLPDI
jgi:hypothetical protein